MHDVPDKVSEVISDMDRNFDSRIGGAVIDNYSTLAPVGYVGFRWATQIDPVWNAYLLALVLSLADEIERTRISESDEKVFSYRYRPLPSDGLFSQESWKQFQEKTRTLAEAEGFVVAADISDFYSRIYHHRLENSLRDVDRAGGITRQIMKVLGKLSGNTSYGLPVGGPAARILSELVLNRVDKLLLTERATNNFCRYADDYRFFVPDMESAYSAIGFLSEKLLRNEGLSLQKTKTRIMTSAEYLSTLDPPEAVRGSAARFLGLHLHYDPYSATADDDYENLKNKIEEFDILALLRAEMDKGRIHTALTRRLVSSLSYLDPVPRRQAALSLLENLETLVPVTPQVMVSLRGTMDHIDDSEFSEQVSARLRGMISDSHFIAKIDLNLAYMIRVLSGHKSTENEQLLISLFDASHGFSTGPAPIIQRDIVLTLARWRTNYWLSDLKNYIATMHPWVRRSFMVASYTLGDEGSHWRQANKPNANTLDLVVRDWAASKFQDINWEVPA
ncbi:RNA-directed DNA polymerase [Nocardia jinanensis]|uniref:Reverse transcriptase n=1 Tax=Nocardia jinanensis TaxID=382504 RepID=A0A917RXH2_9NOCA|nr:RNA-directed DNA polymerase [Nocardia jinanensis]GGL42250.1 reverse transcriptase [Nocardia jinanensis]